MLMFDKTTKFCKAIILELKINKRLKKSTVITVPMSECGIKYGSCTLCFRAMPTVINIFIYISKKTYLLSICYLSDTARSAMSKIDKASALMEIIH